MLNVFRKSLIVIALAITLQYDIHVLLWGQVVVLAISVIVMSFVSSRVFKYRHVSQLSDTLPYILLGLLSVSVAAVSTIPINPNGWTYLAAFILSATATYAVAGFTLNLLAFQEIRQHLLDRWAGRKPTSPAPIDRS